VGALRQRHAASGERFADEHGAIAVTRDIGAQWENAVLTHLTRNGLALLTRNFSCRLGELDLIMRDRDCVVFVEVRYRRSPTRGDGVASIGKAKRAKLVRAAQVYLLAHPQLAQLPCRFDVIGCSGSLQQPQLDWIPSAFEAW
jgi:putative endonuclease